MNECQTGGFGGRQALGNQEAVSYTHLKLICFPEVMNLIGKNIGEGGGREEIPGYTTERLCAKAKEHGVYIHGGSITQALPGEKRSANTSVLISPEGKILATYSKLHMFDICLLYTSRCV